MIPRSWNNPRSSQCSQLNIPLLGEDHRENSWDRRAGSVSGGKMRIGKFGKGFGEIRDGNWDQPGVSGVRPGEPQAWRQLGC